MPADSCDAVKLQKPLRGRRSVRRLPRESSYGPIQVCRFRAACPIVERGDNSRTGAGHVRRERHSQGPNRLRDAPAEKCLSNRRPTVPIVPSVSALYEAGSNLPPACRHQGPDLVSAGLHLNWIRPAPPPALRRRLDGVLPPPVVRDAMRDDTPQRLAAAGTLSARLRDASQL